MNANSEVEKLINNMSSVIIGKNKVLELVTVALLSGGHVLLEDVPGVGKTTLANTLARSIDCGFTRIQFTPDTLPSDITGMSIYNMGTNKFEFIKGLIMNNIILADEINRTSPKTQAALLEAMEEMQITVEGNTMKLPDPFFVIATKNPVEYVGTYNLPEAQLDRFMFQLTIGYPDTEEEKEIVSNNIKGITAAKVVAAVDSNVIMQLKEEVKRVQVHSEIVNYIVQIINKTRNGNEIALGASPRATLSLVKACQGYAYIRGRDYVIPDDVKYLVQHTLGHRIILSNEAKMNGYSKKDVLIKIINSVNVPVL